MAIKRYTMGDGTLTLTGPGDISSQVTSMKVAFSENVTSSDGFTTLSGDTVPDEEDVTYSAQLTGNVVQDIDAAGLVEYSWEHKGEVVAFVFVPNTAKGREVTGTVRIAPIDLGGDVKDKAPRSDIAWTIPDADALALGDVA